MFLNSSIEKYLSRNCPFVAFESMEKGVLHCHFPWHIPVPHILFKLGCTLYCDWDHTFHLHDIWLITYRFHAWWQPSGKGTWKWWSGWWIMSHSFRVIRKWLDTFQLSVTRYDYYDVLSYDKYLDTISGFWVFRMYNPYIFYALHCVHNVIFVQSCVLWLS